MAQSTDQSVSMDWSPTHAPIIFGGIRKRRHEAIVDVTTPFSREDAEILQHQQYLYDERDSHEPNTIVNRRTEMRFPPPNYKPYSYYVGFGRKVFRSPPRIDIPNNNLNGREESLLPPPTYRPDNILNGREESLSPPRTYRPDNIPNGREVNVVPPPYTGPEIFLDGSEEPLLTPPPPPMFILPGQEYDGRPVPPGPGKIAALWACAITYVLVMTTIKVLRVPLGYASSSIKRRLIAQSKTAVADDRPTTPRRRKYRNLYLTPRQQYEQRSERSRKIRDIPGRFPATPLTEYCNKKRSRPEDAIPIPPPRLPSPDTTRIPGAFRESPPITPPLIPESFQESLRQTAQPEPLPYESPLQMKQERQQQAGQLPIIPPSVRINRNNNRKSRKMKIAARVSKASSTNNARNLPVATTTILKKPKSILSWPFGSRIRKSVNFHESPITGRPITRIRRYLVGETISHPSPNTTIEEDSDMHNNDLPLGNLFMELSPTQRQTLPVNQPTSTPDAEAIGGGTTTAYEQESSQGSERDIPQESEPIPATQPEPTSLQESEPVHAQLSEPSNAQALEPVRDQASEPANVRASEPANFQAPEPVIAQAPEPVNAQASEPVNAQASEPRIPQESQQKPSQVPEPKFTIEQVPESTKEPLPKDLFDVLRNNRRPYQRRSEQKSIDESVNAILEEPSADDDDKSDTNSLDVPIGGLNLDPRRLTVREEQLAEQEALERAAREAEEKARAEEAAAEIQAELARQHEEEVKTGGLRQFTREPIIEPLTEAQEERLRRAMSRNQAITAMNGIELSSRDWRTVLPSDAWLNDNIINAYLDYVIKMAHDRVNLKRNEPPKMHAFNNNFYNNLSKEGYEKVSRWAKRAKIGGKDLLSLEYIFIPVNATNNHWTLAVISPRRHTLEYFDSLNIPGRKAIVISHLKQWLKGELGDGYVDGEWRIRDEQGPQQGNMSDCGVHTVTTAKLIALGIDPMAAPAPVMALQRRRIVAELLNSGFHGEFEPRFEYL